MNKHTGNLLAAATLAAAIAAAGCTQPPEPASSAGNVADSDVTEHVKTVLQQDDQLKGFDIQVVTLKGDVRLIGVVDTQAQKDEALKVARAAEGAHTLHDELTLRK